MRAVGGRRLEAVRLGTIHSTLKLPAPGFNERAVVRAASIGSRGGRRLVPGPATTNPELLRRDPKATLSEGGGATETGSQVHQSAGLRRRLTMGLSRDVARQAHRERRRHAYGTLEMDVRGPGR